MSLRALTERSSAIKAIGSATVSATVPASTYVTGLVVLALGLFLWAKAGHGTSPSLDEPFGIVTTLEVIEMAVVVWMTRGLPATPRVGQAEAGFMVVLSALLALLVSAQVAFAVVTAVLALRFVTRRDLRNPGIALLIIGLRNLSHVGPLIAVYHPSALFDAAVVRTVMHMLLGPASGISTIVVAPDKGFAIDVTGGCSSAIIAAGAMEGFLVIVLGVRGVFRKSDIAWAAILIAAMHVLNWVRLFPMALSEDRYEFWHTGNGAALIALVGGLLTCLAAWLATHDRPTARPSSPGVRASA